MKKLTYIIFLLFWCLVACGQEEKTNHWDPLEFLIGTWTQKTETSTVTHTYEWVLDGQFIQSTTDAHFHPADGKESTHQDIGYFSFDAARDNIVFRQFHSEGFINTYVLDLERTNDTLIVLNTEHTENAGGMRAELTIDKNAENSYEMILYLASKDGQFKACQWVNAEKEK